jgi:hypothetical protein
VIVEFNPEQEKKIEALLKKSEIKEYQILIKN